MDSAGNLYVGNWFASTIQKFTPSGVHSGFATNNISGPASLAFDPAGNLCVANYWGGTVVKLAPDGTGWIFASGMSYPNGVACDHAGNVYVACAGSSTIQKFTPSGVGSVFVSGLSSPLLGGLACDSAGNLYAECQQNQPIIEKFTPNGVGSVFVSNGYAEPSGLVFDSSGNLWAANYGDNTIEEFAPNGSLLLHINTPYSPYGIAVQQVPEPVSVTLVFLGTAIFLMRYCTVFR